MKSWHISLKWRLILAFLAVSVTPVLVSSYMAASAIQSVFQKNLEQWITEAALFLLNEITETEDEAGKAAATVGTTLHQRSFAGLQAVEAARPFADLLNSVGYDFIKLYDDTGSVVFSSPGIDFELPKVEHRHEWVRSAQINGRPGMLVGATRSFEAQGRRYSLVVANPVNEALFGAANQQASLDVRVYPLVAGRPVYDADQGTEKVPIPVSEKTLARLAADPAKGVTLNSEDHGITTAFAGVYGTDRSLLGVIAVRLSGASAVFEEIGQWGFFAGLAIIAGALALIVAVFVSNRITKPVRALTRGLRAVTGGDYGARVHESGGRELEELGSGFNAMAEQLDRLKSMEAGMRKTQQLAAFGEAAAVIAHEIRNPLGIIKTSSQVVRMKSRLAPAEDRLIGFVLEEVRRIDRLIQDILDYVRPRELEREALDLRDILAHVAEAARPALAERGIEDDVVACADPLAVLGDRDRLHQAFLNLVLNAMDAMPEGGRLRIVEERQQGMAKISIADQGVGMSEEVRRRAFDPFFTTKTKGAGLGLAKVQAIIGDHGGSISCESAPGYGTTFTICLAVLQNQGQTHAPMHSAG
ncbi:MAG: HAMP domain-containing sensor histidine kinase [Rhodomicrobiaceae bacterium]